MTALPSSLSTEQRQTVEALSSERVGFPRAADFGPANDPGYIAFYRKDARSLMLAWVAQCRDLSDFDDTFGITADAEDDALEIATAAARRELGRDLTANETTLLASCVRDHVIVRAAMHTAGELRAIAALSSLAGRDYDRFVAESGARHLNEIADRVRDGAA